MDFCRWEPPPDNKQQGSSEPRPAVLGALHAHACDVPNTALKHVSSIADEGSQDITFRSTMVDFPSLQLESPPELGSADTPRGTEIGQPTDPKFGHMDDELSRDTVATEELGQPLGEFAHSANRENAETAKPKDLIAAEKIEELWRLQNPSSQQSARAKADEQWAAALNRGTHPDVIIESFAQHQAHWIKPRYPIDKNPDLATWPAKRRWLFDHH
jgi:hypothetical protein